MPTRRKDGTRADDPTEDDAFARSMIDAFRELLGKRPLYEVEEFRGKKRDK